MQTFVGHPQSVKNGSASGPTFSGKFDDNNISISPAMLASSQNPLDSHSGRDVLQDADITNKVPLPMSLEGNIHASIRSDGVLDQSLQIPISGGQATECPIANNASSQPEEMAIEGGTISISSLYSEGSVVRYIYTDFVSSILIGYGDNMSRSFIFTSLYCNCFKYTKHIFYKKKESNFF